MKKPLVLVLLLVIGVIAAVALTRRFNAADGSTGELKLFGNVELRQVSLAFNNAERIAELLVEEGDRVKKGEVLARLDRSRLEPQVAQAEALVAAQRQVLQRLRNGARPEEVAQARAALEAAAAEARNAASRYERLVALRDSSGVSPQELDTAKALADAARARQTLNETTLALVQAGPRTEEIAEAEARLGSAEAHLALLREQLADTELVAPVDAVVRTRVLEPGEMASAQRPVLTLAVMTPKWVRTYVDEPDLGRIRPGMNASVVSDSFPSRGIEGQVGYISSVAEFTPKSVQTEALRSSLVYEVRILVNDPEDVLRLGMPVTVHIGPGERNRQ
jgi:HlyD family secretion protein